MYAIVLLSLPLAGFLIKIILAHGRDHAGTTLPGVLLWRRLNPYSTSSKWSHLFEKNFTFDYILIGIYGILVKEKGWTGAQAGALRLVWTARANPVDRTNSDNRTAEGEV